MSDFRLGSKQAGAHIRTHNHLPQQQWTHSRRFESKAALKGQGVRRKTWCFDLSHPLSSSLFLFFFFVFFHVYIKIKLYLFIYVYMYF